MTSANSNSTTQIVKTRGLTEVDIFSAAQMPLTLAADGNMRWHLELGMKYTIHGSFEVPLIALPESLSPTPQAIELGSSNQNDNLLFNGSDIPHIWGRNNGTFVIRGTTLSDASNGGAGGGTVLFDLVGSSVATTLILDNAVMILFKAVGNAVDLQLDVDSSTCVSCFAGMTLRNSANSLGSSLIGFITLNPFGVPTTSPFSCFLGDFASVSQSSGNIQQTSSGVAFCIDSAATGTFDIIGNSFDGVGEFFAPPLVKAVTLFANADVAITGFSDSSANPGVDTTVEFAGITDAIVGQDILIADEAAYDGPHNIVRVASDQLSFDINVAFSTAGAATLKLTQVASAGHFMVRDQTNTISGTTAYNDTQKIFKIVDADNLLIPVAFVTAETSGTLSATSKNENSVGVGSALNGKAAISTVVSEAILGSNALETDIPIEEALVIISASTWVGSGEIRMSVDSDGVSKYLGAVPDIKMKVDGNITLEPASSSKELSCQIGKYSGIRNTVTFTNGTNTINETSTPRVDGDTITFNGNSGTLPAELRPDIIYFIVSQATNGFQISYTSGGPVIGFTDDGSGLNTYALSEMHGSNPSNDIAANNPRTLVPQALMPMNTGDSIFIAVSNDQDAVDITVSKAYYRNFI